jgi:hypothetical protein
MKKIDIALLVAIFVVAGLTVLAVAFLDRSKGVSREDALPLPDATKGGVYKELGDDRYEVWPASAPVDPGDHYRFTVHTHCGVDNAPIDFDGSLWDYEGPELTRGPEGDLEDPEDEGVITLVAEDEAEFTSEHGTVVTLQRHDGPKVIPGCD